MRMTAQRRMLVNAFGKGSIQPKPSNSMGSSATCPEAPVLQAASSTADVSLLQAAGSARKNVTVNIVQTPTKRRSRMSLKLTKKPKKSASEDYAYIVLLPLSLLFAVC